MNSTQLSHIVKEKAHDLGFLACGITTASHLPHDEARLQTWLKAQMHGSMAYMANNFDKRVNPSLLVNGAKSVVVVLLNYFPEREQAAGSPILAKFAYGKDYHFLMKAKLNALLEHIQAFAPEVTGRAFTDSAPVLERALAVNAGLGWIGKNGNLINKQHGSFFFIGELMLDVELEYDKPMQTEHCGKCTRCLDSCPTKAIERPRIVNGSKCISYLTIENKGSIPENYKDKLQNRVFGCDICQDVCPWNRKSKPHREPFLMPHADLLGLSSAQWHGMSEDAFREYFRKSAVKRAKYAGLMRNLKFLK